MSNQFLSAEEYAAAAIRAIEHGVRETLPNGTPEERRKLKAKVLWALEGAWGCFPPEKMPPEFLNQVTWPVDETQNAPHS